MGDDDGTLLWLTLDIEDGVYDGIVIGDEDGS